MSIVSLRFSNVYAEQDRATLTAVQERLEVRKANVWAYVDAADAGEACRLAVEAPVTGHERLIIAAADTLFDVPSAELARTYFPGVPVTGRIEGFASLLSADRAGKLIGYRARASWRDWRARHEDRPPGHHREAEVASARDRGCGSTHPASGARRAR